MEALKILLAAGADVHATDSRGQTALFECARRPDAVRLLLEAGADPRVVDHDGSTVLTWGFSYSVASAEQKAEAAKLLIAAGANVNAKDKEGKTALMRVADSATAPEMRILLDAGARVNERDSSGKTALSVLIARGGEPGQVGGFLMRLISARARALDEMDKLLRAAGARE